MVVELCVEFVPLLCCYCAGYRLLLLLTFCYLFFFLFEKQPSRQSRVNPHRSLHNRVSTPKLHTRVTLENRQSLPKSPTVTHFAENPQGILKEPLWCEHCSTSSDIITTNTHSSSIPTTFQPTLAFSRLLPPSNRQHRSFYFH